ncbi:MAG TPA: heterodisulfide reductase-related iron-sulfur binding cluster [Bryobacteraceae bacterium]|nr:heterodisulfide reductase-related iron-sulfur binding cluster [Bryobacteraceae bacterium]
MIHFSLPEQGLLALLVIVSLSLFWDRFGKVWKTINASKSDADFTIRPVVRRLRDFLWEVVLQGQVIRQRPLPGIAHALVFWGFCAFALVSLNHFAEGVNLGFLSRSTWPGRFYFGFAALFAIGVAIGIAGLAFRRFAVRPRWLGKVSYESGFIAFLIFLLMLTHLSTFASGLEESKVVWWTHTLAILIFLPLIPHTKHLHLVLSPVTVFLKRDQFSKIPPLVGDDDFGLDTGKDITKLIALQAYSCVECGRCTEHCPANLTDKALNPKEIALGLRHYLNEFGAGAEEPLIGKHLAQEAVFQCTTCGSCEFQCPVGVQHLPMIVGLRRSAVNTGKWEDDYGTKLFLNLERNGNALGFSASERDKFIQKQEFPIFDGTQEYCLWLGCMGAYDPGGRETVTALAQIMRHLRITFGVLKKERCTGDPARRMGNDLAFGELAQKNLEMLAQSKVKKLISICPHCVRTISTDWKEYGEAPPIEHHSEFLARHLPGLPKNGAHGETIAYHDPCYLGRYRNVYDEPRDVISAFGKVVNPERSRERSFCCGAGGGLAFLGEEHGKRVSVERAEQLVATGAGVVGVACPFCNTMFRDALATASANPPKLLDIAQIAAAALPVQVGREAKPVS